MAEVEILHQDSVRLELVPESELLEDQDTPLARVAEHLCSKRQEAVTARIASGIEEKWRYCEDTFNSVDEAGRGAKKMYKPQGPDGPFIYSNRTTNSNDWTRSSAFYNTTAPYVLLSSSRVHEILFPTDQRSWELKPTPKQDVEDFSEWLQSAEVDAAALAEFVEGVKRTTQAEVIEAQTQIDDWMRESPQPFVDVAAEVLEDAARIGTAMIEGPVPVMTEKGIQPGVLVADAKELYPDPNCGENIQDGDFLFRKKLRGARKLREWAEKGEALGWDRRALLRVLEEGPKWFAGGAVGVQKSKSSAYEVWTFQGEVPKFLLTSFGARVPTDADPTVWANVTIINDRICRVGAGTLQGRFTLKVMPWRRRKGHWAGIGVAEDLEDTQRSLNAQVRNLQDNSALSAVPQVVIWRGKLIPANSKYELTPGKRWYLDDSDEALAQYIKNAIFTIDIPCRLDELRENVGLFLSLAEQITGMSGVVRGTEQAQSVGGGQLQVNVSSSNNRRVTRLWDSFLLRPLIQDFVAWRNRFKAEGVPLVDANVAVYGSSVLVERDAQAQAAITAVNLSANPLFGHDPEKMMDQWLVANKFDPRTTRMTPKRKAEMQAAAAQGADDGKAAAAKATVASAQIRAEALTRQAQAEAEVDQLKVVTAMEDSARARQHDERMLQLKSKNELVSYAAKKGIDLDAAMKEFEAVKWPERVLDKQLEGEEK